MSDTSATSLEQIELASSAPAVLDSAHIGDIHGAFGTIRQHDTVYERLGGLGWRP